jgi:hypothetical protein
MSYELWAHRASTAPRRFQLKVRKKIWKTNALNYQKLMVKMSKNFDKLN